MPIVLFIFLTLVEFFWLIQFIDCLRNQRDNREHWIAVFLFLNVLGALYYWRLRPLNEMSQTEFNDTLDSWLTHQEFSLSESKNLMRAIVETSSKYFGLVVFIIFLRVAVDYINLPEIIGWAFFILMFVFLILLVVSVTKTWWYKKGVIVPFISEFIILAKDGKEGVAPTLCYPNDPLTKQSITKQSIVGLLQADLFLFAFPIIAFGGVLHAIGNTIEGNVLFGIVMLLAGLSVGLMFLFLAIQLNSKVIFYHKPDYIFKLTRHYNFWKFIMYGVLMTLIISFVLVFSILPFTGKW